MSALAAELRRGVGTGNPDDVREAEELMDKAADEIERLRRERDQAVANFEALALEVERLRADHEDRSKLNHARAQEIERLRAELDEWKQAAKTEAGLRREFFDDRERLRAALSWLEDHEPVLVDAAREKFSFGTCEGDTVTAAD